MPTHSRTFRIRFNGRSVGLPLAAFGLGAASSDDAIRRAAARFFEVPADRLAGHVVDRHAAGDVVVRPARG